MNYGELKTLLTGYLHRSDLTDMIPSFVLLAQTRMNRDIKHLILDTTAEMDVSAGDLTTLLPEGTLHVIRIRIPYQEGYRSLTQQTLAQNAAVIEGGDSTSGPPRYYAMLNLGRIELAPTPEDDVVLTCVYRKKLMPFTTDDDTDPVTLQHPGLYIYASMIEASLYTNSSKQVAVWKALYDEELADLADADFEARWSDSPRTISNPTADTP